MYTLCCSFAEVRERGMAKESKDFMYLKLKAKCKKIHGMILAFSGIFFVQKIWEFEKLHENKSECPISHDSSRIIALQ